MYAIYALFVAAYQHVTQRLTAFILY